MLSEILHDTPVSSLELIDGEESLRRSMNFDPNKLQGSVPNTIASGLSLPSNFRPSRPTLLGRVGRLFGFGPTYHTGHPATRDLDVMIANFFGSLTEPTRAQMENIENIRMSLLERPQILEGIEKTLGDLDGTHSLSQSQTLYQNVATNLMRNAPGDFSSIGSEHLDDFASMRAFAQNNRSLSAFGELIADQVQSSGARFKDWHPYIIYAEATLGIGFLITTSMSVGLAIGLGRAQTFNPFGLIGVGAGPKAAINTNRSLGYYYGPRLGSFRSVAFHISRHQKFGGGLTIFSPDAPGTNNGYGILVHLGLGFSAGFVGHARHTPRDRDGALGRAAAWASRANYAGWFN